MLPKDGSGGRHYSLDNSTTMEGEMMKEESTRKPDDDKKEDVRGECEYCDPNFMNVPGIEEALKGYDVPSGNPNPGGDETKLGGYGDRFGDYVQFAPSICTV